MPGEWKVEPREWQLQLAQGESFRLPLTLHFPSNGCLGKLESHIEFEITSDRYYKFMLARPYEIGLGDVTLTARQKVHPDGQIEIEQIIENNTDGAERGGSVVRLRTPDSRREAPASESDETLERERSSDLFH
jgi:hypothetical protein